MGRPEFTRPTRCNFTRSARANTCHRLVGRTLRVIVGLFASDSYFGFVETQTNLTNPIEALSSLLLFNIYYYYLLFLLVPSKKIF